MIKIRRTLSALVFLSGLAILLIAVSILFAPENNTQEFGIEEASANGILGEKENSIDVLVLGDSESYSSIIPMQIWKDKGFTSYVCGTSAQNLAYTQTLLNRSLKTQSPKVVILETNAIFRKINIENAALEKITNYFSVFRYHNHWKSMDWSKLGSKTHFTWTDDYKGYRYNVDINPSQKKEHMKPNKGMAEIHSINKRYVKEIKEICDENNVRFILWSTPSTVNWNYKRHNAIQALAEELNCEYVDLNLENDTIQINWDKDTRDKGDHLNYTGAVKVTQFLSEYLEEMDILKDHREDETYDKWDKSLKKFELIVGRSDNNQNNTNN